MKGILRKLLSLFLALTLVLQLLPVQAFALGTELDTGEKTGLLQADSRIKETEPGAASSEIVNDSAETAEIIAEIPEGRDEFQKEFILSNGLRMISISGSAVHYQRD